MRRLLFTLFLAFSLAHPGRAAASDDADELFLKGREQIEENCGDCHDGTRLGLEEGIESVRRAIELGCRDEVAAYKALAKAYGTLRLVFAIRDSSEQQQLIDEQQDAAWKRLLDLVPDDPQVRFEYAIFVDDAGPRLEHARAAAELAPEWADARFMYAVTLVESGSWKAALSEAQTAIEKADCVDVSRYGIRLGELFDLAGRPDEASMLRKEADGRATATCH